MSIANGTTHYDYPQVQLSDRPTFADFNPAFADIDAKLYGLITGAATDEQAIRDLGDAVGLLRTDLGGVSDTATAAKNKADANEEAITLLSGQVSQNTTKIGTKIDSNAIAEPYDTTVTYSVGAVVTYQSQRYRCIEAVLVAEPFDATKWTGEDVETVLEQLTTPSASSVTLSPISGMVATNVQNGISELSGNLGDKTQLVTTDKSSLVNAINEIAGGSGVVLSVTADGVKKYEALIAELAALAAGYTLNGKSILYVDDMAFSKGLHSGNNAFSAIEWSGSNSVTVRSIRFTNTPNYTSTVISSGSVVSTALQDNVPVSGTVLTLYV